jgi:hypothetical protein
MRKRRKHKQRPNIRLRYWLRLRLKLKLRRKHRPRLKEEDRLDRIRLNPKPNLDSSALLSAVTALYHRVYIEYLPYI